MEENGFGEDEFIVKLIIPRYIIWGCRKEGLSVIRIIWKFLSAQMFYFYELHFIKCTKRHLWDLNLYCKKCKRSISEIDKILSKS